MEQQSTVEKISNLVREQTQQRQKMRANFDGANFIADKYNAQPPNLRRYKPGYELFFEQLPVLFDSDSPSGLPAKITGEVMNQLSLAVKDAKWIDENFPERGKFDRTIIGIEDYEFGTHEVIVARWGNGFTTPVHGHMAGYQHEEVVKGKMVVHTYRQPDPNKTVARPLSTSVYGPGVIISELIHKDANSVLERKSLIHNFTSVGPSVTTHYLAEHSRDGKGNGFTVEHFDQVYKMTADDVTRISPDYLEFAYRLGDVLLVRSKNVPELGVHYIVITGGLVGKPYGLRLQDTAIQAPLNTLTDGLTGDVILLLLNDNFQKLFHEFHGIKLTPDDGVVFPNP